VGYPPSGDGVEFEVLGKRHLLRNYAFTFYERHFARHNSTPPQGKELAKYDRAMTGRGTARSEDAQGTPTQSHISPNVLVYEDERSPPQGKELAKYDRSTFHGGTDVGYTDYAAVTAGGNSPE